jgi:RNA polymerase sigma-70 factor (ECF subfamily)
MFTTPPSLLERLRSPCEPAAWDRFVHLYTPLLFQWARQAGLQASDAADLVQEVFVVLLRQLPQFTYDPNKSFRAWLRTVTLNKWREWKRRTVPVTAGGGEAFEAIEAPDQWGVFDEAEYSRHVVGQALAALRPEFPERTWEAFWQYAVVGTDATAVADYLGLSPGSVYAAKSRVLTRLRQEVAGLLDEQ